MRVVQVGQQRGHHAEGLRLRARPLHVLLRTGDARAEIAAAEVAIVVLALQQRGHVAQHFRATAALLLEGLGGAGGEGGGEDGHEGGGPRHAPRAVGHVGALAGGERTLLRLSLAPPCPVHLAQLRALARASGPCTAVRREARKESFRTLLARIIHGNPTKTKASGW